MEELNKILEIDESIAAKKAAIEKLKTEMLALEIERDRLSRSVLTMIDGVTAFEDSGVKWKVQKGRPSVVLKPEITVLSLPEMFISKSPNKVAILKAYKQSPELVESFATIEVSPDKLTYKVVD